MTGVLRRGDVELAGSIDPGLDRLDHLVQRARMSGLPAELTVIGQPRAPPYEVDLVAFRVLQEALPNSIKHAGPAHAEITMTFTPHALELEVCDDGCGAPDTAALGLGHGLVGMRERLALIGGELSAGVRIGGGFRLYARLPTGSRVA